jgi:Holliday junction DNA helicase RuvA
MIYRLRGNVAQKQEGIVVLDVNGVGYGLMVSEQTRKELPESGEEVTLHVHTHVREDAIILFGFAGEKEKELFLLLNTVSGVGPKLALSVLSGVSALELCGALVSKDLGRLTTISGVGKKTAERLCMELGEKITKLGLESTSSVASGSAIVEALPEGRNLQDAVSALVNLGYQEKSAWQALRIVQKHDQEAVAKMSVEDLIRLGLKGLAR